MKDVRARTQGSNLEAGTEIEAMEKAAYHLVLDLLGLFLYNPGPPTQRRHCPE